MATRSRTLKYLPAHELRFAVAPVDWDQATGEVVAAVCLFCRHFGREQRADKKRKSAKTVKHFHGSFRPDQYAQHHQLAHPAKWGKYKSLCDEGKQNFFAAASSSTLSAALSNAQEEQDHVLPPRPEQRGRCFDLKVSIVEVVTVLAVGFGPVESSVRIRDWQTYQYMSRHDNEAPPSSAPRWSPPPNTFQSCCLVRIEPPVYRVGMHSRAQMAFLMEMAAGGMSAAQIARSLKVFRAHAPMLLSDLVANTNKTAPTEKRAVAMAADRAEQPAEGVFSAEGASPEYSEPQTAEYLRLGVAACLSVIAGLLEKAWAFSLELCTVTPHSLYSYLDVRVKFYDRVCGLRKAHLVAIPEYVGKCDVMMFQTLDRVLTALLPDWRKKLLGVTTDGDVPITARITALIKHFQSGSALYRTSNCSSQLQRILKSFYTSIDGGKFISTLEALSGYVRKTPSLVAEIRRYPGYRDQLDAEVHGLSKSPVAFGQEADMLGLHSAMIRDHFQDLGGFQEASLPPSASWWVALEVLRWVTTRASAVFGVLEKQHVTISQQEAVATGLAEEFITGFHAQIHEHDSAAARAVPKEYFSQDGRASVSRRNMVEFVVGSSELARDLVRQGGTATVHATAECFATGAVSLIASLVGLSVSLRQQCAVCTTSGGAGASRTVAVTDALPPVLPHELAILDPEQLDELLRVHAATLRGGLTEDAIGAVRAELKLLCQCFAQDKDLRRAMGMCTPGTRFDVAWSLLDARFKSLEAFAGGLATACPSGAAAFSASGVEDLVLCQRDTEETRLLLADFELESALHAQQFQPLMRLQEEMDEAQVDERRRRKRQKTTANTK
jgi:hypothetical protein